MRDDLTKLTINKVYHIITGDWNNVFMIHGSFTIEEDAVMFLNFMHQKLKRKETKIVTKELNPSSFHWRRWYITLGYKTGDVIEITYGENYLHRRSDGEYETYVLETAKGKDTKAFKVAIVDKYRVSAVEKARQRLQEVKNGKA